MTCSCFSTDPKLATVRDALRLTGLTTYDVAIKDGKEIDPGGYSDPNTQGAYDDHSNAMWYRASSPSWQEAVIHEYGHAQFRFINEFANPHREALDHVMATIYNTQRVLLYQDVKKRKDHLFPNIDNWLNILTSWENGEWDVEDPLNLDTDALKLGHKTPLEIYEAEPTLFTNEKTGLPVKWMDFNMDYLLTPTELWARAFAQYVMTKKGQYKEITDAFMALFTNPTEGWHYQQWEMDDFAVVAEAFDREFPINAVSRGSW